MVRTSYSLLLLTWAVLISPATAQDYLSVSKLRGENGLVNELNLDAGQATYCLNADLSKSLDALVKRDGYSFLTEMGTADSSLTGIFGYVKGSGEKRLFGSYDGVFPITAGASFNGITYSAANSYSLASQTYEYLRNQATISWQIYKDILIMTNGYNRPWRYNSSNVKALVPVAPGMFDMGTAKDTLQSGTPPLGANLDGDYWYSMRHITPCKALTDSIWTPLTLLDFNIHVDDDWVYFWNPPGLAPTDSCPDGDTVMFQLCRTRADATVFDSMFLIKSGAYYKDITDTVYMDSIPDGSLGLGSFPYIGLIDTTVYVADTNIDSTVRLGQVTYIHKDTLHNGGAGIGSEMDTAVISHYRYGVCFYDSSTGALSPMGPTCKIPTQEGNAATPEDTLIQLGLPPVGNDSHLWRILFRAREYTDTIRVPDSAWHSYYVPGQAGFVGRIYCPEGYTGVRLDGKPWCKKEAWSYFTVNKDKQIVDPFFPVDTIKDATDSTYSDTLNCAILESRVNEAYGGIILAGQWDSPVVLNGRVYFAAGSKVYYTAVGEPGIIDASFSVNVNDGDKITALHVYNKDLIVFKNNSWYWVREVDYQNHIPSEMQSYYNTGCVAPYSVHNVPGGGFVWLGRNGIYEFRSALQSEYKETGGNVGAISGAVQHHLDGWGIDDLHECHTWLTGNDRNLVFSFPTLDTSLVYSLLTSEWAVWDFAPRQTTRYDTTTQDDLRPSNEVLFIKNDADSVFKYGSVKQDNSDSVEMIWKSGALFKSPDMWGIKEFGLWTQSDDTAGITVNWYDMNGSLDKTVTDSSQYRYRKIGITTGESHYWQIEIKTKIDSLAVQGIDIWPEYKGAAEGH